MRQLIKHIRRWNIWRKCDMNGSLHKILVLFGLHKSPTFAVVILPEEAKELQNLLDNAVKEAVLIHLDDILKERR